MFKKLDYVSIKIGLRTCFAIVYIFVIVLKIIKDLNKINHSMIK
jgi:hypothetical protein